MNSIWLDSIKDFTNFNSLNSNEETEICIIGAGIFGLTCAYYLSELGFKVIVLDKNHFGKTTSYTSAKITSQHGIFYDYLYKSFGLDFAKDYLEVNEKAIQNIKNIIDKEKISCDFEIMDNYVYTTKNDELQLFEDELFALNEIGYSASFVDKISLPFDIQGAICFKNQAQFNPLKYLVGLYNSIISKSNKVYFNTLATDVKRENDKYIVKTNYGDITSKYVVIASHYPFIKFPGFYFSKLYQSTSYILAVETNSELFDGMYINNSAPIFSFRTAYYNDKKILLIGGGDHKTGQIPNYEKNYGYLEEKVKQLYPDSKIIYKWNTEDCISLDKLPYIGPYSSLYPNMYIGTGFKKWGMTLSNVAANLVVDYILGNENKYAYMFNSFRLEPIKNSKEFKNMLVDSSHGLFLDKLKHSNVDLNTISNGCGNIIEIDGEKFGIYKDDDGKIYAVKPICSHLGCLLCWNALDKTWDCPCHGSRFRYDGKNIYGPGVNDLETFQL